MTSWRSSWSRAWSATDRLTPGPRPPLLHEAKLRSPAPPGRRDGLGRGTRLGPDHAAIAGRQGGMILLEWPGQRHCPQGPGRGRRAGRLGNSRPGDGVARAGPVAAIASGRGQIEAIPVASRLAAAGRDDGYVVRDVFLIEDPAAVHRRDDIHGAPRHDGRGGVPREGQGGAGPMLVDLEVRDRNGKVVPVLKDEVRLTLQVRGHDDAGPTRVEMKGCPPLRQQREKGFLFWWAVG